MKKCTSADLGRALEGNTKIVVTTIQKFPYIVGNVKALKDKHFAVIIDEAHSSTAGKNMKAVTDVLREGEEVDAEDILAKEVSKTASRKTCQCLHLPLHRNRQRLNCLEEPIQRAEMRHSTCIP